MQDFLFFVIQPHVEWEYLFIASASISMDFVFVNCFFFPFFECQSTNQLSGKNTQSQLAFFKVTRKNENKYKQTRSAGINQNNLCIVRRVFCLLVGFAFCIKQPLRKEYWNTMKTVKHRFPSNENSNLDQENYILEKEGSMVKINDACWPRLRTIDERKFFL